MPCSEFSVKAGRAQASILNEWADPFPVRQFLDLHMMVRCLAVLPLQLAASPGPAVVCFRVSHLQLMSALFRSPWQRLEWPLARTCPREPTGRLAKIITV